MQSAFSLPADRATQFLERVMATEDIELDCAALLDVIDRFVDLEVAGEPAADMLPGVPPHLMQCEDCADLWASLHYLAQMEAQGETQSLEELWARLEAAVSQENRPVVTAAAGRSSGPSRWREWLAGLSGAGAALGIGGIGRGNVATAGLALVALIALSGLWLRADRLRSEAVADAASAQTRARELESELRDNRGQVHALMEAVAEADEVVTLERPDGAWLTMFFDPERPGAVVVVGDVATADADDRINCWLRRSNGEQVLAAAVDGFSPSMDWWRIETSDPLGDYGALEVTVGPEGESLFQLALAPDP